MTPTQIGYTLCGVIPLVVYIGYRLFRSVEIGEWEPVEWETMKKDMERGEE